MVIVCVYCPNWIFISPKNDRSPARLRENNENWNKMVVNNRWSFYTGVRQCGFDCLHFFLNWNTMQVSYCMFRYNLYRLIRVIMVINELHVRTVRCSLQSVSQPVSQWLSASLGRTHPCQTSFGYDSVPRNGWWPRDLDQVCLSTCYDDVSCVPLIELEYNMWWKVMATHFKGQHEKV